MDLPALASDMYSTWWSFVNYAASAIDSAGKYLFSVTDASSAASQINRDVYGGQGGYNPIGLSQLFSVARKIANGTKALDAADDSSPIQPNMVAEAPWSRSAAEQAASPQWVARVEMTYTDPAGVTQPGITMVNISQVLPSTVGSLRAQLDLRIGDQLAAAPGTGTPRKGQLISVDSITLMSV